MTQPDSQFPPSPAAIPGTYAPSNSAVGNVTPPGAISSDPVHRATGDHEEVYYEGSPLIRGSFGRVFLHGLVGILIISLIYLIPATAPAFLRNGWFRLSLVLIGLIVLLVPIVSVKRLRYRISNYRIDFESGLLSKNIDTIELWHVEDIKFHQSLLDRIMGVGTISVMSHDAATPKLILHSVPKARELFETLKQRVIAVKRGQGVVKIDTGI